MKQPWVCSTSRVDLAIAPVRAHRNKKQLKCRHRGSFSRSPLVAQESELPKNSLSSRHDFYKILDVAFREYFRLLFHIILDSG